MWWNVIMERSFPSHIVTLHNKIPFYMIKTQFITQYMLRIIGPAMPSRELLAAAAEMTEALRCR